MSKAKEISALYKDIKQQMGKLVSLCHEVEDHAEATADAYQRGYETAKHEREDCPKQAYTDALRMEAYQKGLSDAWDAARKVTQVRKYGGYGDCLEEVFGCHRVPWDVFDYSASEAIEKIRQYEQEKQFHVGDEFENEIGKRFVILKTDGTEIDRYIDEEGKTYCMNVKYRVMRKTGRHFPEIAEVLQKMRES